MIRKRKFYRRWKRRFLTGLATGERLLTECLRNGDPGAVHDLRVTLRRTRLLATVGIPVLGKTQATRFRQWALKLARTLSRVRDHDVMLEWLQIHFPEGKDSAKLRTVRNRLWRSTRPKVMAVSRFGAHDAGSANQPVRYGREYAGRRELPHWDSSAVRPGKLRKQFFKECSRIYADLKQDAARFHELDAVGRHDFRRTLRRLRYLRELALSRREQKNDQRLKELIAFQEALGEMQNCFVVRTFFSGRARAGSCPEVNKLAEVEEQKWLKRTEQHLKAFRRQRTVRI